ncbi:hypothetical protein [Agarivorans sediminis]|nr:hypothetical protein [Agarivorans sp. TSD2052]
MYRKLHLSHTCHRLFEAPMRWFNGYDIGLHFSDANIPVSRIT